MASFKSKGNYAIQKGDKNKMKGYYTNSVYMGFIPSVGKYWQFENESAYIQYMKEVEGQC